MKKIFLYITLLVTVFTLNAQTTVFTSIEIKAKDYAQNDIADAFDNVFKDVTINQGAIILERLWAGRSDGMTHRLVYLSTLGVDLIDQGDLSPDKNTAFWAQMNNYVEEWGSMSSGRMLSWQPGDFDKYPFGHIWNIKGIDESKFKMGHDKLVKEFSSDFEGRVIGFGTYDINRPDGATHWVALTGKDRMDHLMFTDKFSKSAKAQKLLSERGPEEIIKDFEVEILKTKQ